MSAIKPIMRELRQAALKGFGAAKDKLHQVADNITSHVDGIVKKVKGQDTFDGKPDKPDYSATPHKPGDGETSGPVVFYDPRKGATPEQQAQINAYVDGSNDALNDGYLAPNGRVSTAGQLRDDASAAAAAERAGGAYSGHAGHVPDTTWTGRPDPHSWLDLDPSVNTSLGSQSLRYPIGYQPTEFVYGGSYPS
ncbi:hypothetical protein [Microbacterium sp. SD291]|uniref:hypothetical protein n=1 Tax=Microbacterium sp. SD291 TaxID=2782007 RepID=UPI001A970CBB|nr:hypothetical protein [Microbacterium sp. SD291]